MPVRLQQDALQGAGEEHRADGDVVRAGESVPGSKAIDGACGSGASEVRVEPQIPSENACIMPLSRSETWILVSKCAKQPVS